MSNPHANHDLGFARDLTKMIGRRRVLSLITGTGLVFASGGTATALECVALPWETAGPFPADGTNRKNGQTVNSLTRDGVIRRDLRTSFGGMTAVADGVQLDLELTLVNAADCSPLAGYAIYIWHCDRAGQYSLYEATDTNYLRGVGVADAGGTVRFTTIVPGCYSGRWPHIHFEIFKSIGTAVGGEASVLTAQIALPEDHVAAVYASDSRYPSGTRNLGRLSLARDNVFRDNTPAQLEQQTLIMTGDVQDGYLGRLVIPVDF